VSTRRSGGEVGAGKVHRLGADFGLERGRRVRVAAEHVSAETLVAPIGKVNGGWVGDVPREVVSG
jgi:hypothetical protein